MAHLNRRGIILVLPCIIPAVLALPGWPAQGTIVEGNAIQFDQVTWERHLEQPNATGNFHITGFDLSQPFPSEQVDGWQLSINVTGNIPDSETLNNKNASGKVYTGTSLYLQAPQDIVNAMSLSDAAGADETTWKVCVTVMTGGAEEDTSTADNGTCSSLPSQCIEDFQSAYAVEFSKEQDCYKLPATPSSCGDSLNQANLTTQQYPIDHLNGTEIFVTASDAHDSSDNTVFDSAIKQVWPVLVVWGWNNRANASDDTQPTVQLTCVRANNVKPGSSSSQSSAPVSHGSAIVALVVAGVAAMFML